MSDIPEQEIEAWVREQKKKGRILVPMGDSVATIDRTVTAQLNYKDSIMRQIDQTRWALLYGEKPFAVNVVMLVMMIPEVDKDDQFKEDLKNSKYKSWVRTGSRTDTSGFFNSRREITQLVWIPNYFTMFEACINLFRRRGMLWGQQQVEVM